MSAFGVTVVPPLPVGARNGVVRRLMSGPRFDWLFILAGGWLLGGAYLDGWAHVHGKVDQSFFTPWHAVLYSGFAAVAGVLIFQSVTRYRPGRPWRAAIAPGYELSVLGALIFLAAGL